MHKKYNFKDFTENNYKKILSISNKRYTFINFKEVKKYKHSQEFILWRHDVDFSVHRAYKLAKIEKRLGIKSTYFLQLGSGMYNIFEEEIKKLIFKIIKLGHTIALHFDPTQYDIKTKKDLEKYLKFEKNILNNLFNINVYVFSFHNPTEDMIKIFNKYKYCNMINTYASYFKHNIKYCSDSNGFWRYARLETFLIKTTKSNKQVLTHPEWWQKEVLSPYKRVKRAINGRAKKSILTYSGFFKGQRERENVK